MVIVNARVLRINVHMYRQRDEKRYLCIKGGNGLHAISHIRTMM